MSAFNGAGTFVISGVGLPYVTGTTISSTVANQLNNDLATGLSTCLTKDGQTIPIANIPLGGFKLTGVGAPTAPGDALVFGSPATVGALRVNGNIGVNMAPPAWGAQWTAMTLNSGGSIAGATGTGPVTLYNNLYHDGAVYRYINADAGAAMQMASGQSVWVTAPAGAVGAAAPTTQRMSLDVNGGLSVPGTFGNQSYNGKGGRPPGVAFDMFSFPFPISNLHTGFRLYINASNDDANSGYASYTSILIGDLGSFAGAYVANLLTMTGSITYSINSGVIGIVINCAAVYSAGTVFIRLTPVQSGASGFTSARVYATLELFGTEGLQPITRL